LNVLDFALEKLIEGMGDGVNQSKIPSTLSEHLTDRGWAFVDYLSGRSQPDDDVYDGEPHRAP
jgi:hypothetical protein